MQLFSADATMFLFIFSNKLKKTEAYKNPFMYRVFQLNMTHFEVLDVFSQKNQLCIGAEMWGNRTKIRF